ncbi:Peptidoglycan/LPS O-acetylase OafA/YrhL, contains acyltransferase and SGNH-hydrolase domains [Cohaesibacter sp. ES.047]|uniref:acyltransferase family protein n=1 Tax=Cohaesibacter sp. ES.047 TaxID=1798205 RepID=UPI000BC0271E|nr:acyltransferase [Cohaesibacter sp. ES.047]SNY91847.1 Peptidoglycan/LPS O-acetylase OafA/YrhL, contains acyltransferase and SGNH-hydrolase domains [Cohaesibacter sp. ES.047]
MASNNSDQSESRPVYRLFALWRLIAAIAVMMYHIGLYGPPAYHDLAKNLEMLNDMLDMFFVVSGFLIFSFYIDRLTSFAEYKAFLVRRVARLYPLHLLTLACFCLVWLAVGLGIVSAKMTESYSFVSLIEEVLMINAWGFSDTLSFNYVSWSLSAEWFAYLMFPLLVVIWQKWQLGGLIGLMFVTILALEGLTWIGFMPFPSWLEATTWGAYRVFADFVLGATICVLAQRRYVPMRSQWWPWAGYAMAVFVLLSDPEWGYLSMIAIALALFLAAQVEINAPERTAYLNPLMPLSAVSFGIYMWHPVVASAVIGLVWQRWLLPDFGTPFWVMVAITVIGSMVVSLLSAYFFEAPVRRAILNWQARREARRKEQDAGLSAARAKQFDLRA